MWARSRVQIAKAFGAGVTGVDIAEKLDVLRAIGADHVIDHTREDFTRGSEQYDVILDIPGTIPSRRSGGCSSRGPTF